MQEIESNEPEAELEIEAPPGLLPRLSEWGLEEVERGVVEDTFENRRTIKSNKGSWNVVFDTNGNPTPYIQVVTAEMNQAAQAHSKANLLTDPDDYDSDYLSGMKLLLAHEAEELAPTWVLRVTRLYMQQTEERRNLGADADLYQSRLIDVPARCKTVKADGTRCWGWSNGASESLGMCRVHAKRVNRKSQSGMSVLQAARNRLISATAGLVDGLEDLAFNAESESVRLQAMNSMLDRAGVRGGFEIEEKVEVTVTDSGEIVRKRLDALRKGQEEKMKLMQALGATDEDTETVEAEVVEDDE